MPLYGSDSRDIYAVTEEDALGEYPVIVIMIDVDDLPYAGVLYPGFDVYMAHQANIIWIGSNSQALARDPRYQTRMQHRADFLFNGKIGIESKLMPNLCNLWMHLGRQVIQRDFLTSIGRYTWFQVNFAPSYVLHHITSFSCGEQGNRSSAVVQVKRKT